jgi:hypothetical protein
MKKIGRLFILLFFISLTPKLNSSNDPTVGGTISIVINSLESFIKEKKFLPDAVIMYPGITNKTLKTKLTELINESAKDFLEVATGSPSDQSYRAKIKLGLGRFDPYFNELSSEDLDRVYKYYLQLIDIVGLKNSDDQLKKWRYGS